MKAHDERGKVAKRLRAGFEPKEGGSLGLQARGSARLFRSCKDGLHNDYDHDYDYDYDYDFDYDYDCDYDLWKLFPFIYLHHHHQHHHHML